MKKLKLLFLISCEFSFLIFLFSTCVYFLIGTCTKDYNSDNLENLPSAKVGLLLGTSRNLGRGNLNQYFFNRIDAAVELFKSGKINFILVSGDNSSANYNEPQDMKNELVLRGIPATAIYMDFAGFRTLDSILRAQKVFGQQRFIIISQRFHNQRAIFLARRLGIEAYGYNAKDVDKYFGFKTKVREYFARTKVFVDLLFGVDPKFLGEKIVIA